LLEYRQCQWTCRGFPGVFLDDVNGRFVGWLVVPSHRVGTFVEDFVGWLLVLGRTDGRFVGSLDMSGTSVGALLGVLTL
jgi:hypothetical protein